MAKKLNKNAMKKKVNRLAETTRINFDDGYVDVYTYFKPTIQEEMFQEFEYAFIQMKLKNIDIEPTSLLMAYIVKYFVPTLTSDFPKVDEIEETIAYLQLLVDGKYLSEIFKVFKAEEIKELMNNANNRLKLRQEFFANNIENLIARSEVFTNGEGVQ